MIYIKKKGFSIKDKLLLFSIESGVVNFSKLSGKTIEAIIKAMENPKYAKKVFRHFNKRNGSELGSILKEEILRRNREGYRVGDINDQERLRKILQSFEFKMKGNSNSANKNPPPVPPGSKNSAKSNKNQDIGDKINSNNKSSNSKKNKDSKNTGNNKKRNKQNTPPPNPGPIPSSFTPPGSSPKSDFNPPGPQPGRNYDKKGAGIDSNVNHNKIPPVFDGSNSSQCYNSMFWNTQPLNSVDVQNMIMYKKLPIGLALAGVTGLGAASSYAINK